MTGWSGSCRTCPVRSSPPRCRPTWFMQSKVRIRLLVPTCCSLISWCLFTVLFSCRGPGPGGLCSGAAGGGQLAQLPGPVRSDPAQCGPTPGPALSAQRQEPAEPPKPGRELQPAAVQTGCRVRNAHTHRHTHARTHLQTNTNAHAGHRAPTHTLPVCLRCVR